MATPYITLQDGRARLTVLEGGRLHSFDLALTAVGRLAAEASAALWTVTQGLAAVPPASSVVDGDENRFPAPHSEKE